MLRFPFSIKTKFPYSPHTRVCTCVHAHKRFWSRNSAKQFPCRVSMSFSWIWGSRPYGGLFASTCLLGSVHVQSPLQISTCAHQDALGTSSVSALSGNQKAADLCTKQRRFSPFPILSLGLQPWFFLFCFVFLIKQSERVNGYVA